LAVLCAVGNTARADEASALKAVADGTVTPGKTFDNDFRTAPAPLAVDEAAPIKPAVPATKPKPTCETEKATCEKENVKMFKYMTKISDAAAGLQTGALVGTGVGLAALIIAGVLTGWAGPAFAVVAVASLLLPATLAVTFGIIGAKRS
jgi:hypothetical protein